MNKTFFRSFGVCVLCVGSLFCAEGFTGVSVVDYAQCISASKYGKEEQENVDKIREQLSSLISETDKELSDLSAKFEDTAFLETLSPKAEEEMKARHQTLMEDRQRYQWQFGQIMQQASYQLMHKIISQISRASEKIAQEQQLDYVINKEACFYYRPSLDLTNAVIETMDQNYDLEVAQRGLSSRGDETVFSDEDVSQSGEASDFPSGN